MLIEGDCLIELDELGDASMDLLCTDPPYGNASPKGFPTYGFTKRTIAGDEHPLLGLAALASSYRLLKRNSVAFFFLGIKHLPIVRGFVEGYTDYRIKDWIVWNKARPGLGWGIRPQHEIIGVFEKGKPKYNSDAFPNVITVTRLQSADHIHEKPVELIKALILHASQPNDTVLDPFAGTCTTAVAAHRVGRRFVCIEKEPKYIEIGRQRLLDEKKRLPWPT